MNRQSKSENPDTLVFETHADDYDAWFEKYPEVFHSEVEAIREFLPPGNSFGIEVGLGTGRFAQALGIKEGVEPSSSMRDLAVRRGIEVMEGTAEHLPYGDQRFDFVLMTSCISYLDNVPLALMEAGRVLKRNGILILGFIEKNSLYGKHYENIRAKSTFYKTANFYTKERVFELLKDAGFGSPDTRQTLFEAPGNTDSFEPSRPGHNEGSFIVVKAIKK